MSKVNDEKFFAGVATLTGINDLDPDSDEGYAAQVEYDRISSVYQNAREKETEESSSREFRDGYPIYRKGDRDPTMNSVDFHGTGIEGKLDGKSLTDFMCLAKAPGGYVCTWHKGHQHPQHVAAAGHKVLTVWDK